MRLNIGDPRRIIAIAGQAGSGKSTAAGALVLVGYRELKFAKAFKDMMEALLANMGIEPADRLRMIEGDLKESDIPDLQNRSPRWAMQTLGTEWGRELMGPDLWTDIVKNQIEALDDDVVISDLRFPNELALVKELGGEFWFIERDGQPGHASGHASESSIKPWDCDRRVPNNFEDARGFRQSILDLEAKGPKR